VEWSFASSGSVAISPDGKRIAYGWRAGNCGELRVSALDGSSTRVLRPCRVAEYMNLGAWMPDSRRILAVSYGPKDQTYRRHIISVPDGAIRDIGQPGGYMDWGYPSPDGRHVAYGLKGAIFVYDTATEQDSVLVQDPATDNMVGWTPDGSGIVFLSNPLGTRDLYLLGIENGRPRGDPQLLRKDFGGSGGRPQYHNTNLYLTRDGRLFRLESAGTGGTNAGLIVPVDDQTGKLTGKASPLDPDNTSAFLARWSADGKSLYYKLWTDHSPVPVLAVRSEETGQKREITLKPKLAWNWGDTVLSPDGRRLAVNGTGENHNFGVFAIDSESGDVSQLVKIPDENHVQSSPNWSPDGKAIFYEVRSLEKSGGFTIRRKDLTTGEETDVHRGFHTDKIRISPDGTRFVYVRFDLPTRSSVLGILDIQSGKELELWRGPEDMSHAKWTPDGRHVLVTRFLKEASELWRFPAAGGPCEKLHFFPEQAFGFNVHPSGKRMAFTQSRTNYEVWVLENFLPSLKSPAKQ
jgi:Tol biopolymer transport system component